MSNQQSTTRAERRARASNKNLVRQDIGGANPKTIWHAKYFNKPQFGDFTYWWKRLNEAPKQNSKRTKKRGLNAVFNLG